MENRRLVIPREFERAVLDRVQSGRYRSPAEVLNESLLALAEHEKPEEERLEALRREIQIGLDQFERGQFSDGREVIARLRNASRSNPPPIRDVRPQQQKNLPLTRQASA